MGELKEFYKRHLPHYQPEGATFHVVFRLAGSLPHAASDQMRQEREKVKTISKPKNDEERKLLRKAQWGYFKRFDSLLDKVSTGPHWLSEPAVAEIVKDAIHYRDEKAYDLITYSIMPNHVHMVMRLLERIEPVRRADCPTNEKQYPLTKILQKLKWNTSLRSNRVLKRSGPFWQGESYDHVIRNDDELDRTIWYVLQNPVKAGLVQSWEQWPWNYCKWNPL